MTSQIITSESEYKAGLFPIVPPRVQGQDTLLVGTDGIPRIVDEYMTTRDIRRGNYNKLIRISTSLFTLDITMKATSKNAPYKFDVVLGVDCHVSDSCAYYMAMKTHSIESSLNTALSRIVTQEAKKFELTDDEINDNILSKFYNRDFRIETLGISYNVVSVDAVPDSEAERNYIKKMTDHTLTVKMEEHKASETQKLTSRNMESAIIAQVTDGKIDMKTALEQLSQSNRSEGYNKLEDIERLINFVRNLQKDNLITDDEAGQRINEFLRAIPASLPNTGETLTVNAPRLEEKSSVADETLDDLLPE